jgi:hypothetical protein
MKSDSEVIVVGELNGKDFFKRFSIPPARLPEVVQLLSELGGIVQRGRVDMPYMYPRL